MKITKSFANAKGEMSRSLTEDAKMLVISIDDEPQIRVALDDLTPEMMQQAALHGLSQKIGDAASGWKAGGFDPLEAMQAVASQVVDDKVWNKVRQGDGSPQTSLLIEALAAVTGKTVEKCKDAIDGLDDAQKKDLRNRPTIAAEIAKIKAARQAEQAKKAAEKAADADDDLTELF